MNICIYGAASSTIDDIYMIEAEKLGATLASRGHSLIFGGGNEGSMGAVARGFSRCGGDITGIAPRFFDKPGVLYDKCTQFIYPEDMRERKSLLESMSQATVVTPGGIGTYEEFMEIFTLKSLGRIDRPIVLYNINGYYDPMVKLLMHTVDNNFMSRDKMNLFMVTADADTAIEYIENYNTEQLREY
ncbi:MAG: TIGR00730 family Rossman fold protein [Bacillota bacterium]|nr:TIGR00730 family Rossman fold protein [Bacillota bacterium]